MSDLDIIIYPDPVLKENCEEVTDFGADLHKLLEDMAETMYKASGIGLAAPQVGVVKRVTVIDVSDSRGELLELINPKITKTRGLVESEEGCLSIPQYRDTVERFSDISLEAQNRHGEKFTMDADDLLSICIQHELDHLDGVLFVDHLSQLKRKMFKNWYRKNVLEL